MELLLKIDIKKPAKKINYRDKILLTGSCFTEHIGNSLDELKFSVLQNPNGILFEPMSVCKSLVSYVQNKQYDESELVYLNEVWNSWDHHSRFSHIDKTECLNGINVSQKRACEFLKTADFIIITLGSSFSYFLRDDSSLNPPLVGRGVANCHRAPAPWFAKHLSGIDEIISGLENCCHQLLQFNPKLNIIFTISPVRHIRDGVVENNRSKARLIEAVHYLVNKTDSLSYFPAYELVIDVLRDYRFFDVDLVHPNYMSTEFVLEKFAASFIDEESRELMEEVRKIVIARKHKPFQPLTKAHRDFLFSHAEKTRSMMNKYPFLHLNDELSYFISASETL
jgi:hypothetical protein